ncbi:MAG: alpha/beta fold hydrolase [Thermodesulfobacteriota bacterium]
MSVQPIFFKSGPLNLEGLLFRGNSEKAVVISHPHPLYGGDMENYVVSLISRAFEASDWTTLRFNFRGVGRSQGEFDRGAGETEDVSAAVAYLKALGLQHIVLAGYSFGAWVDARAALTCPDIQGSILVSPPVGMMDFSFLAGDEKTRLVIAGDADPYAPEVRVRNLVQSLPTSPMIKIIKGADHFYSYGAEELMEAVKMILPQL